MTTFQTPHLPPPLAYNHEREAFPHIYTELTPPIEYSTWPGKVFHACVFAIPNEEPRTLLHIHNSSPLVHSHEREAFPRRLTFIPTHSRRRHKQFSASTHAHTLFIHDIDVLPHTITFRPPTFEGATNAFPHSRLPVSWRTATEERRSDTRTPFQPP